MTQILLAPNLGDLQPVTFLCASVTLAIQWG